MDPHPQNGDMHAPGAPIAALRARALTGTVGALVEHVDLRDLDDPAMDAVRALLQRHQVLAFRGQALTPADEVAFARRLGPISVHPYVKGLAEQPEVLEVIGATHHIAVNWHQDQTYRECPPALTMLMARVLPEAGADTMFADQHTAFDQLSSGMQKMLLGLRAVHRGTERAADAGLSMVDVEHVHPVVIRHPGTGRHALFVNPDYTVRFEGWTDAESAPLLRFLYEWSTRAELTYRHRWEPGDFVLWDNRNLLHRVVPDATGDRLLHKVTIAGDALHG
jgi:taurine dioxygenase